MTAIDTVIWKHREPSVEGKQRRSESLKMLMLWGSDRNLTRGSALSLAVSEHLVLLPGVLWSRILSFYRILMSLLPPPLFTTDKEWNWSVCGTAACALSSGHRHQEPRWEKAIKLYTVYFNWALDPFYCEAVGCIGNGKKPGLGCSKDGL